MILTRRNLITGLSAFIAAPAIVRASSLMAVKPMENIGDSARTNWMIVSQCLAQLGSASFDEMEVIARLAA